MIKRILALGVALVMVFAGMPMSSQASEADQGQQVQMETEEQAVMSDSGMSVAERMFFDQLGRNGEVKTSPESIPYRVTDKGEGGYVWIELYCDVNDNPKYVHMERIGYMDNGEIVDDDNTTYDVFLQWLEGYKEWILQNDYYYNPYYMIAAVHYRYIIHADGTREFVGAPYDQNEIGRWRFEEEDAKAAEQVRNFVSRMYTVALGREAEEAGLQDWTRQLVVRQTDGAGIANGFIMSDEFKNKNVSDEKYVDILYHTFFDRDPDEGGKATWLAALANGNSRAYVLAGFVNSVEFDNLCNRYGISRGEMQINEIAVNPGVRSFVERCYTKVLGREGEQAGVEDWTNRIATGAMSAEDTARSFFFSEEYTNKHTDNETFVETLYQTFMDRASDPAGKSDWVGRLSQGTGRQEVLEGFSRSEEFSAILREYGL